MLCTGRKLGEDFGEGDLSCVGVLLAELLEVTPDESTEEGGGDVVRVPFDHEGKVELAGLGEVESPDLVGEQDPRDDGGTRASQPTPERDLVVTLYREAGREVGDLVAPEDVECYPSDQVLVRVQRGRRRSLPGALEYRDLVVGLQVLRDRQGEVEFEGESEDVCACACAR